MQTTEERKWTRATGGKVNDRRADTQAPVFAFVVFRDSFMSGWGEAPKGSFYALACDSQAEVDLVRTNGKRRSEMKRCMVAFPDFMNCPKMPLTNGQHLSIADKSCAGPWYKPGAFTKD